MAEIPNDLIINWDQTAIKYVPVSQWTMERVGSKRVEIAGLDDKRQITALFAESLMGDFLPIQLVYQGKTENVILLLVFQKTGTLHLHQLTGVMNKQRWTTSAK